MSSGPGRGRGRGGFVSNPFIKKHNLEWEISLSPRKRQKPAAEAPEAAKSSSSSSPPLADIEAGKVKITDHATHFAQLLAQYTLQPYPAYTPRLAVDAYQSHYLACLHNPRGAHFVIHQHDHPVAGPHYDLRLQINGTSSVSWAIMYGLPGDPNSQRRSRNAAETRIHTLWNHLVETGSRATGSLLIWDTGSYEVLPQESAAGDVLGIDTGSDTSYEEVRSPRSQQDDKHQEMAEQEKLGAAFANRKIRLRLHGAKLPETYVVNLYVTRKEDAAGRAKASKVATGATPRRRRRRTESGGRKPVETSSSNSDSEEGVAPVKDSETRKEDAHLSATERELREVEDEQVRRTNAYIGADNTIGSVYQRRWYLSLDRPGCGFIKRKENGHVIWEKASPTSENTDSKKVQDDGRLQYPFYVRGPKHERSAVTGRLAQEIMKDEGVTDYIGRQGWRPVLN